MAVTPNSPDCVDAPPRPDRGWQQVGDVARSVVKAPIVEAAIRGAIPRSVADRLVGGDALRGA